NKRAYFRYTLVIVLVTSIFLLLSSTVYAASTLESKKTEQLIILLNQQISIQITTSPSNKTTTTNETSQISIQYQLNNITVTPPPHGIISTISDDDIWIEIDDATEIINYTTTLNLFTSLNYQTNVEHIETYTLKLFNTPTVIEPYNAPITIKSYEIYWTATDITTGTGSLPCEINHTYTTQGTYPVAITLIDDNDISYTYQFNHTFSLTTDQYLTLWADENKETIATGSAGTLGGLALLGLILTETGKYKLVSLLLIAIPMYQRIHTDDVLDLFVRGEIYGYIKGNPGVHYNHIMRELKIQNGTLSYHLHMLEKTGMIKSRKEGIRYRAFYTTEMKFPEHERHRLSELQIKMLQTIKEQRGINQKDLAKQLNEKHQTINYNIKILNQAGIIDIIKHGRQTHLYIIKHMPQSTNQHSR
ncbi:MAG: winged helix-turn-helix transcriptional regulator, partial [Candidatus Thermoplasmatota archaeon]|nr:winged helix-turn-helix transcriptional regulator [Candidatus Thermoplasmatota archaeon]